MIEQITDRLLKSWKTTLVAGLIFAALGVSVYLEYSNFKEAIGWFAAAFTFLLSKDGKKPPKEAPKT